MYLFVFLAKFSASKFFFWSLNETLRKITEIFFLFSIFWSLKQLFYSWSTSKKTYFWITFFEWLERQNKNYQSL